MMTKYVALFPQLDKAGHLEVKINSGNGRIGAPFLLINKVTYASFLPHIYIYIYNAGRAATKWKKGLLATLFYSTN
jgi:hypothetical protein